MFLARAWVLCRSFLNASSCCMVAVGRPAGLKGGERRSKLEVAGFGEECSLRPQTKKSEMTLSYLSHVCPGPFYELARNLDQSREEQKEFYIGRVTSKSAQRGDGRLPTDLARRRVVVVALLRAEPIRQ